VIAEDIVDGRRPSWDSTAGPAGVLHRAVGLLRVKIGIVLVATVVVVAVAGPLIAPHGETDYVRPPNSGSDADSIFGTDRLGQDIWSRFLLGGRSILVLASLATVIGVLVGIGIGVFAAYARGRVDEWIMRSVDVVLAVPPVLVALVAMTSVGPEPWLIVGSVAFATSPRVARVAHGAAAVVVERDFVETSECMGESRWYVMTVDLVPNISGPLLVEAGIRSTYSIAIVASLAFLGFTTGTNDANWAVMVQENRAAFDVQPWGVLLPTVALVMVTLGTGLITDGLARATSAGRRVRDR
jgi:peptide/nickel transport system permease protein